MLAAGVLYAVPSVTPVGPAVGIALAVLTLSLPFVAGGLAYGLAVAPLAHPWDRPLARAAALTVAVLVGGFALVLVRDRVPRVVGDATYAVGILSLFVVSAAVVLLDRR